MRAESSGRAGMGDKSPVLLLVLVEATRLRWFVAALGLDGAALPLLRSEVGDLDKYLGLAFEEQVSFLRHRFCGVLQRGCDRLWARQMKACQFVFVFEASLPEAANNLTQAVADHFVEWMLNPPVVVFTCVDGFAPNETPTLGRIAGEIEPRLGEILRNRLGALLAVREEENLWELSPKKRT
jgi:hypothetical protein